MTLIMLQIRFAASKERLARATTGNHFLVITPKIIKVDLMNPIFTNICLRASRTRTKKPSRSRSTNRWVLFFSPPWKRQPQSRPANQDGQLFAGSLSFKKCAMYYLLAGGKNTFCNNCPDLYSKALQTRTRTLHFLLHTYFQKLALTFRAALLSPCSVR